jgi:hypothetical protein
MFLIYHWMLISRDSCNMFSRALSVILLLSFHCKHKHYIAFDEASYDQVWQDFIRRELVRQSHLIVKIYLLQSVEVSFMKHNVLFVEIDCPYNKFH